MSDCRDNEDFTWLLPRDDENRPFRWAFVCSLCLHATVILASSFMAPARIDDGAINVSLVDPLQETTNSESQDQEVNQEVEAAAAEPRPARTRSPETARLPAVTAPAAEPATPTAKTPPPQPSLPPTDDDTMSLLAKSVPDKPRPESKPEPPAAEKPIAAPRPPAAKPVEPAPTSAKAPEPKQEVPPAVPPLPPKPAMAAAVQKPLSTARPPVREPAPVLVRHVPPATPIVTAKPLPVTPPPVRQEAPRTVAAISKTPAPTAVAKIPHPVTVAPPPKATPTAKPTPAPRATQEAPAPSPLRTALAAVAATVPKAAVAPPPPPPPPPPPVIPLDLPPGEIRLEVTAPDDFPRETRIVITFRPYPKAQHTRPITKAEAAQKKTLVPKMVRPKGTTILAGLETAAEGFYDIRLEGGGTEGVELVCSLFENTPKARKKNLGKRKPGANGSIARLMMPEGIFWDDESAFQGSMESSDSITRFNAATGLVWREYR